jgi:RNA polymerase sigma-70 factor (TIGR02943 family)
LGISYDYLLRGRTSWLIADLEWQMRQDQPMPFEDETKDSPSQWLDLYGDKLFQYAVSRVKDPSTAEDLVQETLLSAFRSWTSFEGRAAPLTWLRSILKNKICDLYRKRSRLREEYLEEKSYDLVQLGFFSFGIWSSYIANWASSPEKTLENQQFNSVVDRCLSTLPARHREIFELKFLDELPPEEICKVTGISSSNYWVILHRSRLALRKCVELHWHKGSEQRE